MQRQAKHTLKAVKVLIDAEPRFASLVPHGANQTPFRKLANDTGQADGVAIDHDGLSQQLKSETQETDMATKAKEVRQRTRTAAKSESTPVHLQAELHKIVFPAAKFADEDSVRKYLGEHGYDKELTVKTVGTDFEVMGHEAGEFEGSTTTIDHGGVTMHVGILKQDAEDGDASEETADEPAATKDGETADTPSEPAKDDTATKTDDKPEPSIKDVDGTPSATDNFAALVAKGVPEANAQTVAKFSDIAEVLTFWDDLPPGYWDIVYAYTAVVRSGFDEGDTQRIKAASAELGDYLVKMGSLFGTMASKSIEGIEAPAGPLMAALAAHVAEKSESAPTDDAEATGDAAETPAPEASEETADTPAASDAIEGLDGEADASAESDAGQDTTEGTADAAPEGEEAAKGDDTLTAIQSLMTDMLAPVVASVKEVSEKVDAMETSTKSQEERVDTAPETSRQVRKGSDEGDAVATAPEKQQSFKYADNVSSDPLYRDALGLS